MRTAFLSSSPDKISYVYAPAQVERLAAASDLLPGVFSKADALAGRLADAEAVFSTWGMPAFTEEEIAASLPKLRAVFYAAGATDAFVRPFLARGIKVMSAWRANAGATNLGDCPGPVWLAGRSTRMRSPREAASAASARSASALLRA